MAVSPMRAGDLVAILKEQADTGGDGFLARIKMDEAGNLSGRELHMEAFLKFAKGPS